MSDPGQDYSHRYWAPVLEFPPGDVLVLRNSCPGRDHDIEPE